VTSIANALMTLAVFTVVIGIFLLSTSHAPSAEGIVAYAGYCAALVAIVVGFSLASSVLFLRYRDLNQVWDMALQAGFFVAPIIYPIGILPERYHVYLYFWAPTPVIQFVRAVLVDGRLPSGTGHAYLAAAVALCLIVGTMVYRKLGPRSAEYL